VTAASHFLAAKSHVARTGRLARLIAPLPLLALFTPAPAWSDFYRWTDEQGNPVLSNVRPPNPDQLTNFALVMKEPERAVQDRTFPPAAERALLDKIENLERQIQAQPAPAAPHYGTYYAPPPPPPPPPYYGSDYPGVFYPGIMSYPAVIYPVSNFARRPGGVHRGGFARGPSMHRGRR